MARHDSHVGAASQGLAEAHEWARRERNADYPRTLDERTVEQAFGLRSQAETVSRWAQRHNVRRAVIADFSKNVYATHAACGFARLDVLALADDRGAFSGAHYRGLPIVRSSELASLNPDGIIVSNPTPAQVRDRTGLVRRFYSGTVLTLWQPQFMHQSQAARAA